MITQNPTQFTADPLALQFMTQGQMGYMPQAQYLTPAEYGAFRTLPGPQTHNFANQDPGLLQSYLIRNRGSLPGLPAYIFNTYNPAVNQQEYMYRMRTRASDNFEAFKAAVLDAFNPLGIAAGLTMGAIPGFAVSMLAPSITAPYTDRIRDARAIQNLTMSKIVGGRDMNQATGAGFNALAARDLDSFIRLASSKDALFKKGDWDKLLQLGIEHGQFDYAGNVEQYKDALKKIRKSVTTVMEVVGSTDFKDIMKEYKRMQTMGANLNQYNSIMRKEQTFARIAGMSHGAMVDTYGQQGALIYQQAGLTGIQGSLQAMHNAAIVSMMQRTGSIDPGTLSRFGGISGLVQTMTQESAVAQNRIADHFLPFFAKSDFSGLDPNRNIGEVLRSGDPLGMMYSIGGSKLTTLEQKIAFDRNKAKLQQELQEKYNPADLEGAIAYKIGKENNLTGRAAVEYGNRMLGYSPYIASVRANAFLSTEMRDQEERQLQLERHKQREERALAESPFRKMMLGLSETFTKFGERVFGSMAENYLRNTDIDAGSKTPGGPGGNNYPAGMDDPSRRLAEEGLPPEFRDPTLKPDIIESVEELFGPAEHAMSGGNVGAVDKNALGEIGFGTMLLSQDKLPDFYAYLGNSEDAEVRDAAKKLKAAWDQSPEKFKDVEKAKNSELAEVFSEVMKNPKILDKYRQYFKKSFYDPLYNAMSPMARVKFDSSRADQMTGALVAALGEGTLPGGGQATETGDSGILHLLDGVDRSANLPSIGILSKKYESGEKGVFQVTPYWKRKHGGQSYGTHQIIQKQMGESFLPYMKQRGGKAAEWADRFAAEMGQTFVEDSKAAYGFRLQNTEAANEFFGTKKAENLYKSITAEDPNLMDGVQREFLLDFDVKKLYNALKEGGTFDSGLKFRDAEKYIVYKNGKPKTKYRKKYGANNELWEWMRTDPVLQEMAYSFGTQHNPVNGAYILLSAYKPGMTKHEFIAEAYRLRIEYLTELCLQDAIDTKGLHDATKSDYYGGLVLNRGINEEKDMHYALDNGFHDLGESFYASPQELNAYSSNIEAMAKQYKAANLKFNDGGVAKGLGTGYIDCSSYGCALITADPTISQEVKNAAKRGLDAAGGAGMVDEIGRVNGGVIEGLEKNTGAITEGMLIGYANEKNQIPGVNNRKRHIGHVLMVYKKDGKLWITNATNDDFDPNNPVQDMELEKWLEAKKIGKNGSKLYGVRLVGSRKGGNFAQEATVRQLLQNIAENSQNPNIQKWATEATKSLDDVRKSEKAEEKKRQAFSPDAVSRVEIEQALKAIDEDSGLAITDSLNQIIDAMGANLESLGENTRNKIVGVWNGENSWWDVPGAIVDDVIDIVTGKKLKRVPYTEARKDQSYLVGVLSLDANGAYKNKDGAAAYGKLADEIIAASGVKLSSDQRAQLIGKLKKEYTRDQLSAVDSPEKAADFLKKILGPEEVLNYKEDGTYSITYRGVFTKEQAEKIAKNENIVKANMAVGMAALNEDDAKAVKDHFMYLFDETSQASLRKKYYTIRKEWDEEAQKVTDLNVPGNDLFTGPEKSAMTNLKNKAWHSGTDSNPRIYALLWARIWKERRPFITDDKTKKLLDDEYYTLLEKIGINRDTAQNLLTSGDDWTRGSFGNFKLDDINIGQSELSDINLVANASLRYVDKINLAGGSDLMERQKVYGKSTIFTKKQLLNYGESKFLFIGQLANLLGVKPDFFQSRENLQKLQNRNDIPEIGKTWIQALLGKGGEKFTFAELDKTLQDITSGNPASIYEMGAVIAPPKQLNDIDAAKTQAHAEAAAKGELTPEAANANGEAGVKADPVKDSTMRDLETAIKGLNEILGKMQRQWINAAQQNTA